MNSLCNDCKNTSCPMQSGIKRNKCAFYIPSNKSAYVPLETVLDLTEYMCRDCHLNCKECMLAEPLRLLKNMNPSDVRPVVRARWIPTRKYDYYYKCSVCNEIGPLEPDGESAFKYNFCPNCGADMREPNLDTTKGDNYD